MFGLFKQKDPRAEVKKDFESMIRQIRAAEPIMQTMVGRGIYMAEEFFKNSYTKESYQSASFSERSDFVNKIRDIEVTINQQAGPIRLCSIGYALFNRWLAAVAMSDEELLRLVEVELNNFKKISDAYANKN